ncbi:MAG: site-specific integrase [Myxococcota bacterium]
MGKIGTIRRKSEGRWFVDLRREAGIRIYSDRGEPLRTRAQASRLLTILRGQHRKSNRTLAQLIEELLPDQSKRHLVSRHLAEWMSVKQHQADDGTVSPAYLGCIRSFCKPGAHFSFFDDTSIHEIDFKRIQRWRFWLVEIRELQNPRYVANVMGHFHAFLSWLRDCGEIETIPRFDYPKVATYKPRILTMTAQAAILDAIPEKARGIFLICSLGIRPAEARALDVSDYSEGWLTVDKSIAGPSLSAPIRRGDKRADFKRLPLFGASGRSQAMSWIEKYGIHERIGKVPLFVHPRTGDRWTATTMRRWWRKASEKAGVPPGRMYEDTKHSFATDAVRRQVPERLLQRYLGHSSVNSTRRYAQLADDALVDVLGPPPGEIHALPVAQDRKR